MVAVPRFRPFRALRYAVDDLALVTAPPYDVMAEAEVRERGDRSPHAVVHVDVPLDGDDRYERAAERLRAWRADGVLVEDPAPSFTLYRLRFTDAAGAARDLVGVLGGLEVVDEGAGGVLPHERTTPKASTDRLDLTRATRANLSPVWGLSLATGLTALLREPGEVLGRVVEDGVEHVVERVDDPARVAAIAAAVAVDDVLVADGHHRYAVSRTYRDEVRAVTGGDAGPAEETLAFVGELVPEQLSVAAIHRLYADVDPAVLREALARRFDLAPVDPPGPGTLAAMAEEGFLTLVEPGATWALTPRPGAFDGVRALDGGWLETALADVAHTVSYQHGLDPVLAAVQDGQAAAAVLIRPVGIAEIERTAREGLLMPPKSTFFTPKLRTGFVLRPLEG
ncbi:DUF1015 domain-containing protein [Microlunatus capsulatus]